MSTDPQSRSIAELTRQLTDQGTRLARSEVELAKAEPAAKGREALPPVPEQTVEAVKEDVAEAKTRAQEGRA